MVQELFKYWRIWDGKKKKMHYPSEDTILKIFDGGIGWGLYESHEGGARLVSGAYKESILMPWSGFEDINDNKIYLNDVIEFDGYQYKVVFYKGFYSIDVYKNKNKNIASKSDVVFMKKVINSGLHLRVYDKSCKIVGNIYPNKKLIP